MILILLSDFLLALSVIYISFGIIGIFRYPDAYSKLLTSSQIDTVAAITTLIALMLRANNSESLIKLIFILIFVLLTGPVSNHIIANSACVQGYNPNKGAD